MWVYCLMGIGQKGVEISERERENASNPADCVNRRMKKRWRGWRIGEKWKVRLCDVFLYLLVAFSTAVV